MDNERRLKTYVVQNPVSGLSDAETIREKIREVMDEHQIPFEIYETTGKEELREVVKAAINNGFEQFIAVGGDGTISGVASGLVHTKLPLIIVPTGTVNALARELQIPFTLDEAIRWWVDEGHRNKFIDLIMVKDRFYLLNVSAGTSAGIMKEAKREDLHRFGVLVFLWHAIRRYAQVPSHRFSVLIDGKSVQFRASEVVVANSGVLLGLKALQLDPEASLDNGRLTVCHARMQTILDYVRVGLKMATKQSEQVEDLNCLDALKEVTISASRPIPVQGDGEQIGYTPVTVKLIPHSLHLILPHRQT